MSTRRLDRVMVGIASIPERAATLQQVVAALAPQADRICVSLNGYPDEPRFLDRYTNVEATLRPDNGGDAEKFAEVDDWDGYVVTCDDDVLYPADYIDTIIAGVDRYGRRALVSFHGGTTRGWNGAAKAATHKQIRCLGHLDTDDTDVNVLGTGTLAYHAPTIPLWRDVFRSPNMADVHLACHARTLGIPMVALAHEQDWLTNLKAGEGIYEANKRRDRSVRDTTDQRRAELARFDWTIPPPDRPRVRVSIATCDRPHLLQPLLEDLEREARSVDLQVGVFEDQSDADYLQAAAIAERNGWAWTRFPTRLGRDEHWQLVDRELQECRNSDADWFIFLPDDIRLVRHAIPRAIHTWNRLDDPATLTLWRLRDHEGQTNWTGVRPVDRGEAWEVFHVDGIYLCRRDTLDFLDYRCPRPPIRRRRSTSSGVGRAMSLTLHADRRRMYRVNQSLAIPVPLDEAPSIMNPDAGDRIYPAMAL